MPPKHRHREGRSILGVGCAVFALTVAAFVFSTPVRAQDVAAGVAAWDRGGCSNCHGDLAQGGPGGEQPAGPSLRRTRLDRQGLVETISCGRPGTGMPAMLIGAYKQTPCRGLPVGQVPARTTTVDALTQAQIEALADFLVARVVGKATITRQDCGVFYGDVNYPTCAAYR